LGPARLRLRLLDPQVARELGIVAANLLVDVADRDKPSSLSIALGDRRQLPASDLAVLD
jgi:hypothetical protein